MNNMLLRLLGQGQVREAGNDLALRKQWLELKERYDMGEMQGKIPDYPSWKKMKEMQGLNG